ncbi:unnamed protein product, partial [Oppiella nova]
MPPKISVNKRNIPKPMATDSSRSDKQTQQYVLSVKAVDQLLDVLTTYTQPSVDMEDDLKSHYDCIITGTGLTQSVVGAALARVGKSVFHCDQNHFYSQEWQSMNFTHAVNWCHTTHTGAAIDGESGASARHQPLPASTHPDLRLLRDRELYRNCRRGDVVSNVCQISYLCDEDAPDVTPTAPVAPEEVDVGPVVAEVALDVAVGEVAAAAAQPDGDNEAPMETTSDDDRPQSWSLLRFNLESRRFNLDLTPRLLYSRGSMVDLLVSSNISRYAEFKAITRILTTIDGQIVEVPVSRGDIFNNKDVSVIDKRMLMKFMTFCSEYDRHYADYESIRTLEVRWKA